MITILVDHDIEGQGARLYGTYVARGWLDLVPIRMVYLVDVGLSVRSSDRIVWRYVQTHGMLLLTHNRNQKGIDSLEQTLRDEAISTSLPVITVGSRDRVTEREYRERCVERLVEIIMELDNYRGTARLFIP